MSKRTFQEAMTGAAGVDLYHAPAAVVMDSAHPGRRSDDWEVGATQLRALLRSGAFFSIFCAIRAPGSLSTISSKRNRQRQFWPRACSPLVPSRMEDRAGRMVSIGPAFLARLLQSWWRDRRAAARVLDEAERRVADLERVVGPRRMPPFARESGVLFLRTDWARGVKAEDRSPISRAS